MIQNPTQEKLQLSVFDISGHQVLNQELDEVGNNVSLSFLDQGFYVVVLEEEDGHRKNREDCCSLKKLKALHAKMN